MHPIVTIMAPRTVTLLVRSAACIALCIVIAGCPQSTHEASTATASTASNPTKLTTGAAAADTGCAATGACGQPANASGMATDALASAARLPVADVTADAMTAAASGATIVTDHVVSEAQQTQFAVPVTFGQVFKDGDVPRGATLAATLNGQLVPMQVDAKATNPADGSLRHAVLTVQVPTLTGGANEPLAIASSSSTPAGSPVTITQLLTTPYDATVSLNIGGTLYTAKARGVLQAAELSSACAPWGRECDLWLSGPLVSEWVVNAPLVNAKGIAYPTLRVYFAIRAYAGQSPGTVGKVRTDIVVANTNAYALQVRPQYVATLTSGTASYTSPALTQYPHTRWHYVLWWNDDQPQVYLRQDTQYIQATKAVSRYMTLTPDAKFLASVRQSCPPLDHCDQTQTMGNTGAQAAIGPLPRWTSVYIIDPDIRTYRWMLADTDALGAYGIHYRDPATGFPISIQKHPYVTTVDWAYASQVATHNNAKGAAYKADLLPGCAQDPATGKCWSNPDVWDDAHQPAESYVPYMVTGSWYYMSELAFGASHNEIWSNEAYRGYSKGLIDDSHGQVRGKAWVLREMADAAWLLPDSYPLKAEFNADVENSLVDWNQKYTDNTSGDPLHIMTNNVIYAVNGGKNNGTAPWQHNFLTWSAGHAAELGFAGAAQFRDWLAKFEIDMMTDSQTNPTDGYCWLEASAYAIAVKDAAGNWLPNFTAVYAATFPQLVGLTCNSSTMVAEMGKLQNRPWQVGEMSGYPYSPVGYPANLQIGLASAADSGLPNAHKAWAIFESRSVQPAPPQYGYNNYPNFAVLPRSTAH